MTVVGSPIEEIKARLDIAEVIGEYVPLKPSGPERLKARCPFHNEKTPSFMVSRERQIYHCFGCGEGGDVLAFVQKMEGLDFPSTLRLLAKKANVPLPSYDPKLTSERTAILDALKLAASFYHEVLLRASAAESARQYLGHERKLLDETIEQFGLGYAPADWESCTNALKKKGITEARLVAAGLAVRREKGSGVYDRFRNRIMFPIRDPHGAVIGFGGRAMDANDPAKYINTPQTLVYNKSTVLYGLDLAKHEIRKQKVAVVVEGYMDCIASHQVGVTNVVASSGTALTEGQVLLLKRYAPTTALAFDMDPAGETAAKRGIAVAWKEGLDVKVISLPFGKDPDECIRQEPAAWTSAIGSSQPILDFYFSRTLDPRDSAKVQDKKDAAKILLPILGMVADSIEQTHYLQKLATWLNVDEHILRQKLTTPRNRPTTSNVPPPMVDRRERLSQRLLGVLQLEPSALPGVENVISPEALTQPWQNLYKFVLVQYSSDHTPSAEAWRQSAAQADPSLADAFAIASLAVSDLTDATPVERHREVHAVATELARLWLTHELRQLTVALQRAEASKDAKAVQELSNRFTTLTAQLRQL